jgi:hypothetical protein
MRRHLTLRQFLTELDAMPAQPRPAAGLAESTSRDLNPPGFGPAGQSPMMAYPQAPPVATAAQPISIAQTIPGAMAPPLAQPAPLPPTILAAAPPPAAAAPQPAAAPVPQTASPASAPAGAAPKAGFRETLWFKKGEVEEYLKSGQTPTEAPPEDARPIEDRYVDDGTLTAADRAKFSLRTGGTQMLSTVKPPNAGVIPGERMSEREQFEEYAGKKASGSKVALILILVIVGLGAIAAATWFFLGSAAKDKPPAPHPPASLVAPAPRAPTA